MYETFFIFLFFSKYVFSAFLNIKVKMVVTVVKYGVFLRVMVMGLLVTVSCIVHYFCSVLSCCFSIVRVSSSSGKVWFVLVLSCFPRWSGPVSSCFHYSGHFLYWSQVSSCLPFIFVVYFYSGLVLFLLVCFVVVCFNWSGLVWSLQSCSDIYSGLVPSGQVFSWSVSFGLVWSAPGWLQYQWRGSAGVYWHKHCHSGRLFDVPEAWTSFLGGTLPCHR